MSDRDKLICRLKALLLTHKAKQKKWQEENKLPPDCGCITKESCVIACLYPEMIRLGVTFDDVANFNLDDNAITSC